MIASEAERIARERLSDRRYHHTVCVVKAASELAPRFGADQDKAVIAAYLHDIFKEATDDVLLKTLGTSDIIHDNDLPKKHAIWHSFAAAEFLSLSLNLPDDICNAVRFHTTGREGMTPLEKTLFLADYISEDRTYEDCIAVREIAEQDVELALLTGLKFTIRELLDKNAVIDSRTIDAYNSCIV